MEWVASTVHTTSEHSVPSITRADAHISTASSWQNWRPCRFKWTHLFLRKKKSCFWACAITFQRQSTALYRNFQTGSGVHPSASLSMNDASSFLFGKAAGVWSWLLASSDEFRIREVVNSLHITRHHDVYRDNFSFTSTSVWVRAYHQKCLILERRMFWLLDLAFICAPRAGIRHLLWSTAGRPPKRRQNFSPVDVTIVTMTWLSANVKWHALTIKATVSYSTFSLFKFVFPPCCVHGSCVCVCVCERERECEFQSLSHAEIRIFFQLVNFHADY